MVIAEPFLEGSARSICLAGMQLKPVCGKEMTKQEKDWPKARAPGVVPETTEGARVKESGVTGHSGWTCQYNQEDNRMPCSHLRSKTRRSAISTLPVSTLPQPVNQGKQGQVKLTQRQASVAPASVVAALFSGLTRRSTIMNPEETITDRAVVSCSVKQLK